MKNILFSLIFVLLAGSLWAQQQTDVLQQMEQRMHNDPIMQHHANWDQGSVLSGEMDFSLLKTPNNEIAIRVDSVIHFNPTCKFTFVTISISVKNDFHFYNWGTTFIFLVKGRCLNPSAS